MSARLRATSADRWLLGTALAWSALSLWLFGLGHAPSRGVFWFPRELHYPAQAMLLPLVMWAERELCARVLARFDDPHPRANASLAIAWPAFGLIVVPDALLLAMGRHDALGMLVRITGPIALIAMGLLFARAVPGGSARRVGAAALALVCAGTLAALVVR